MEFLLVFFLCVIIGIIIDKALERQCKHSWEILEKGTLNHKEGPEFGKSYAYGNWYISRCKNCGKLKSEKFK